MFSARLAARTQPNTCGTWFANRVASFGPGSTPHSQTTRRRSMQKASEADWAMYNHGVRGWRHNPAETRLTPASIGNLTLRWRFPIDDATDRNVGIIRCTPAVVNGYVYFG